LKALSFLRQRISYDIGLINVENTMNSCDIFVGKAALAVKIPTLCGIAAVQESRWQNCGADDG
jgi:hypothetical protein